MNDDKPLDGHDHDSDAEAQPEVPPRYEKPQLRRYDQIDQVRPYGPSEI